MEIESDFVMNCLESGIIPVTEAENVTNASNEKKQSWWEKLKAFFARIFGVFQDKAKAMFANDKKWMDENFNKLDKIDVTNAKMDLYPFWTMSMNRLRNDAKNFENKLNTIANRGNVEELAKYKDIETLKKEVYSDYLDENGNLTEGLKNYYRVGNAKGPIKQVTVTGADLKRLIPEWKQYCQSYQSDVVPLIQKMMTDAENQLKKIETAINNKINVKEAFCDIENAPYSKTELAYCENFVLLEAENTTPPAKPEEKKEDNKPASPTSVKLVNTGDAKQAQNDAENTKYKNMSSDQLVFMKNYTMVMQTDISCMMTVMEERFRAYMNAMKALVAEFGKEIDNVTQNPKGMKDVKDVPGGKKI
jgi:hypothetical protein